MMPPPPRLVLLLSTLLSAAVGCDQPDPPSFRLVASNSEYLSGVKLNGTQLSSFPLSAATSVQGVRLVGVVHPSGATWTGGLDLDPATGELQIAVEPQGRLGDTDLVGAALRLDLDGDAAADLELHVDDVLTTVADDGATVHEYALSQRPLGAPEAAPLCPDDGAVSLLRGAWDTTGARLAVDGAVTLACPGDAIGKCARWGYRPLDPASEQLHQTCTRMVRADYTYDGTSFTHTGTEIRFRDRADIVADEPGSAGWTKEAEWGPSGLRCIRRDRLRQPALVLATCGAATLAACFPTIPECKHAGVKSFEHPDSLLLSATRK